MNRWRPCIDKPSTVTAKETAKQDNSSKLPAIPRPKPASKATKTGFVDPEPLMHQMSAALANRDIPTAIVFQHSSRLLSSPDRMSRQEQALFTRILNASIQAREVNRGPRRWNNVLIMVCDKINDLPAFLYLDNPRCHSIFIDLPNGNDRGRFIRSNYPSFHDARLRALDDDLVAEFSVLTDGFTYYELLSLVGLSVREKVPITEVRNLCERFKYGVTESDWDKLDVTRLQRAEEMIRARIKGQDGAVARLLEIVKRAKLGLAAGSSQRSQRPRGVLFFAGPTGVGKTELAKGLAELLFGEEQRLIRFDMSEYASAHADQKLLGAPPGYVGYEEGGKLTNAIKAQPFSVLLFDEIEKAHPSIFDKFLQILDDGRLTDGKGETVYFSESIIIFTSNLGSVGVDEHGQRKQLVSPKMSYAEVRKVMLAAIRRHFNEELGRPEILNRFGENFIVFDFIRPPVDAQIMDRLLEQLVQSVDQQHGLTLQISATARSQLVTLARANLEHGGRGIRNVLEAALVNPLSSCLFEQAPPTATTVLIESIDDRGEEALCADTLSRSK